MNRINNFVDRIPVGYKFLIMFAGMALVGSIEMHA